MPNMPKKDFPTCSKCGTRRIFVDHGDGLCSYCRPKPRREHAPFPHCIKCGKELQPQCKIIDGMCKACAEPTKRAFRRGVWHENIPLNDTDEKRAARYKKVYGSASAGLREYAMLDAKLSAEGKHISYGKWMAGRKAK